jgi:protein dispatched 1
MFDWVDENFG